MAFVFIEGVDRTGKSTLAANIVKVLADRDPGCEVVAAHFGPPKTDAVHEYVAPFLRHYHPWGRTHVVLDRAHVGELVWPKYFDRPSRMTREELQLIEQYFHAIGAVGVLAERDVAGVEAAFRKAAAEGDPEPLAVEHVASAAADFKEYFLHEALCPYFLYEHEEGTAQAVKIVDTALKTASMCTEPWYAGDHGAKVLEVLSARLQDR